MSDLGDALVLSAAGATAVMFAGWLASIPLRDVSIVDSLWGVAFVVMGWIVFLTADGDDGHRTLMVVLVTLWGVRLAAYIALRKIADPGEDKRYAQWRERNGPRFVYTSLGMVFLLQAAIAWVIAIVLAGAATGENELGPLDGAGVAVWAIGMFFEVVGDAQLARFKSDPANRGRVMKTGLWRYTRHPNYFGEACVWWGMYLVALSAGAWWTVFAPILVTLLVTRISGAAHLEENVLSRRPGYDEYAARTSVFLPLPPKKALPKKT